VCASFRHRIQPACPLTDLSSFLFIAQSVRVTCAVLCRLGCCVVGYPSLCLQGLQNTILPPRLASSSRNLLLILTFRSKALGQVESCAAPVLVGAIE